MHWLIIFRRSSGVLERFTEFADARPASRARAAAVREFEADPDMVIKLFGPAVAESSKRGRGRRAA